MIALLVTRAEAAAAKVATRNASIAAAVREETTRLRGEHLSDKVKNVRPASQEEVAEVATALVEHLERVEVEPSKRGWFKLFKQFDENGDGHISYLELVQMIRRQMRMPATLMPEARIRAVWHYMDLDCNGWIDIGEFGRFFRQADRTVSAARKASKGLDSSKAYADKWQEEFEEKFREPTLAESMLARTKESTTRLKGEKQKLELQLALSRGLGGSHSSSAHARSLNGLGETLPPLRSPRDIV